MLLTSYGTGMHWDGPHAHGTHGGGSGGSSDGYIASIQIDTQAGAGLGKITAIRQPGGVAITSPESTTEIHYTRDEIDNLLSPLTTQIANLQAQVAVMSFQLSTVQGSLPQVRISGILKPLKILSFHSASISEMYTDSSEHGHVWVSHVHPPVDHPPLLDSKGRLTASLR